MTLTLPQRTCVVLIAGALLSCPSMSSADDWVEIVSPNFTVISNAGDKRGREVARELEKIRAVFQSALLKAKQDPKQPIIVLAVKNEKSLRELLPQYWERDGPRPAGVFQRTQDGLYVVLRVDARRESKYRTIYHEYFHLLLSLNVRNVPVWLNEGMAEFWEQTIIRRNQVEMGNPNWRHAELLQRISPMPLDELLAMDRNPHHVDPDRVSVFYAQAWALTHMLMIGRNEGERRGGIGAYMQLVDHGVDSVEAFEQTFGSVSDMEKALRTYLRQQRLNAMRMNAPEEVDAKTFATRELSNAESLAVRGNFLVRGMAADSGAALLKEALSLDERSASAMEGLGYYHFRKDEHEEAARWLTRAIEAGSESYSSHFYSAQIERQLEAPDPDRIERGLRRAIELNPGFAPAYAQLAAFHRQRAERLEGAHSLALRAVQLEPDNAWYWTNLGYVLLQMEKPDEARRMGERALTVSRDGGFRDQIERFMTRVDRYEARHAAGTVASGMSGTSGGSARPAASGSIISMSQLRNHQAREGRLLNGDFAVRGEFTELRCVEGGGYLFVVTSETKTFVLDVEDPSQLTLWEDGKPTQKDMHCGAQTGSVLVAFTPSADPDDTASVSGQLRLMEFLTATPF